MRDLESAIISISVVHEHQRADESCGLSMFSNLMDRYEQRETFRHGFSYAIPCEDALNSIAEFVGDSTICEVGAGLGLWAALLKDKHDVNSCLYDINDKELRQVYCGDNEEFMPVSRYDSTEEVIEAINENKDYDSVLMMIWPCYDVSWAADYTKALKPQKLIYIGEGSYGCTGDAEFHDILHDQYEEECIRINKWQGMHDGLNLLTRKS